MDFLKADVFQPAGEVRQQETRRTWDQLRADHEKEGLDAHWAEELRIEGGVVMPYAASTAKRLLSLGGDLCSWVAVFRPAEVGQEFAADGITERFQGFLLYKVTNKRTLQDADGTQRVVTVVWNTLNGWRWDLVGLAKHTACPSLSTEEYNVFSATLGQYAQFLKVNFNLSSVVHKAVQLSRFEMKLMLQEALGYPASWDKALQDSLLALTFSYIGCRPGFILPTDTYRYFLPWKNITVKPVYRPGVGEEEARMVLDGFWVVVKLETFKGFQYLQSMEINYPIRPVTQEENLLLNYGATLMAVAFRRDIVDGYKDVSNFATTVQRQSNGKRQL